MTKSPVSSWRGGRAVRVWGGNRDVDLFDPRPEDFDLGWITKSLARKPRYEGTSDRHITVCHHLLLCDRIGRGVVERRRKAHAFDSEWVRRAILIHDFPETYIGDMVHPLKSLEEMRPFREIDETLLLAMGRRWLPVETEAERKAAFFGPEMVREVDDLAWKIEVQVCFDRSAWGHFGIEDLEVPENLKEALRGVLALPDPEGALVDVAGSLGMS